MEAGGRTRGEFAVLSEYEDLREKGLADRAFVLLPEKMRPALAGGDASRTWHPWAHHSDNHRTRQAGEARIPPPDDVKIRGTG